MRFLRRNNSFLIPLIITINVIIFFIWNFSYGEEPLYMLQNFLISWNALAEGRPWTLITSVFSHNTFWHLFINMYVLMNFGSVLEKIIGSKSFIQFYFTAGLVSSLAHSIVSAFLIGDPSIPALGASGAISGLILVFCFLFPREKLYFFGIVPIPAFWGALAFIGIDLWGLFAQSQGGGLPIGHGAHLGGAFTGILYYFFFLRRRIFV